MIRDLDIDFNNILLDEKSFKNKYEKILIYDISYKTFMGAKPMRIRFDKLNGFIKIMMELDIYYYMIMKDIMQFIIGLNILEVKKVVLKIVLIITLEEPGLIHIIFYLLKKYWLFMF